MIKINGSFYKDINFEERDTSVPGSGTYDMPMEQSYIENILRLNKGKKVRAFYSFTDSTLHKDKVFEGIIEQAGRDHLIISDPTNGKWYMHLMIYLDYVEFDEKINYQI